MVETYDTTLPIYKQILLVWLDNLIFRMGSWRRTIHIIHGPHCSMLFSRAEVTEQFLRGISYDHAPPTFDMKIIIFPSHPIINKILKLQKMNLLEMKNTTISPKNSTTKTNYTIEVFKKIRLQTLQI